MKILDKLVEQKVLLNYKLVDLNEDGNEGKRSANRNTQKLTLQFPNNVNLDIETFCLGCSEDTCFVI